MVILINVLTSGLVAGWLSSTITEGRGLGLVGSLVTGISGAMIGFLLAMLLAVVMGDISLLFISPAIGAMLSLLLVNLVKR